MKDTIRSCAEPDIFTERTVTATIRTTGGWRCHCGEPKAWVNLVDVTNGSFEVNPDTGEEERIDGFVELEILVPPQECVCSCGNKHYSTHGVYRIPDDAGRVRE